jgi:hypothetical protein
MVILKNEKAIIAEKCVAMSPQGMIRGRRGRSASTWKEREISICLEGEGDLLLYGRRGRSASSWKEREICIYLEEEGDLHLSGRRGRSASTCSVKFVMECMVLEDGDWEKRMQWKM